MILEFYIKKLTKIYVKFFGHVTVWVDVVPVLGLESIVSVWIVLMFVINNRAFVIR